MHLRPVADPQRIALLDVVRGVAVLGILLANMPYMGLAGTLAERSDPYLGGDHWLDRASHAVVYLFADTKFITIFSLLFGAGLGLMSEKALAAGATFNLRYTRRLALLFMLGAAHVMLLWFGDILMLYSVLGFVAMWFRRCRVRTLVTWAVVLLALNLLLLIAAGFLVAPELARDPGFEQDRARYAAIFGSGSFAEMAMLRLEVYGGSIVFLGAFLGLRTLALFLLGIAAVKAGVLHVHVMQRRLLGRWIVRGFLAGVPLMVVSLALAWNRGDPVQSVISMVALYVGGLALAAAYVSLLALWMHTNFGVALRYRLAAVGRMALTSYLSHSLITGLFFNHLGQFDRWGRPWLLAFCLAIFAFQLWISPIWLRHFHYGPAEWLWRAGTYLRRVPFRRG